MATAIPSIACIGVIGRNNNPLHVAIFPSHDPITNSFRPIRTPLQFSLLLSSTLDIFELRSRQNAAQGTGLTGDFGLLHAVDERLAAYGYETNTGVKFVVVVDMRGKSSAGMTTNTKGGAAGGGGGGGGGGNGLGIGTGGGGIGIGSAGGLREGEMRPVFKALQAAYVRLLQNPFFEPDEHSPPVVGGGGAVGKKITSRKFEEEVRRVGEAWSGGVGGAGGL